MFRRMVLPLGAYQTMRVEPLRYDLVDQFLGLHGPIMQIDIVSSMREPFHNDHARMILGTEQMDDVRYVFEQIIAMDASTPLKNLTEALEQRFLDTDYFTLDG